MNDWILTDPDCSQHVKKLDDYTFSYIECRECDDEYVVCHAVIDTRDYSIEELFDYISGYYDSFEEIIDNYGYLESFRIIAECIFEQTSFADMEFNVECEEFSTASEFISDWIEDN